MRDGVRTRGDHIKERGVGFQQNNRSKHQDDKHSCGVGDRSRRRMGHHIGKGGSQGGGVPSSPGWMAGKTKNKQTKKQNRWVKMAISL